MSRDLPPPQPFQAYPYEIARGFAKRIAEIHAALPEKGITCGICNHPRCEQVNTLLLAGAEGNMLRAALGVANNKHNFSIWRENRFFYHRDFHVVPFIEKEIQPAHKRMAELPYPDDGTTHDDKSWWYMMQQMHIYQQAIKAGQLTNAIKALHEMREIDMEMGTRKAPKQAALPSPDDERPFSPPDSDDKLENAFQRSRIRQARDVEVVPDGKAEPGADVSQAGGVAEQGDQVGARTIAATAEEVA